MTDLFEKDDPLLTRSEIEEKVREYHAWGALLSELRKKRQDRREWFQLVAKLIGKEKAHTLIGDIGEPEAVEPPVQRRPRVAGVTWTGFLQDYIESVNRPVSYAELREAVAASVLGPKLRQSDKSFYGALGKLEEQRAAFRRHGWVFTPKALNDYERKLKNGEIEPLPTSGGQSNRSAPVTDAILEFVLSHPEGVTGRQVIDHMLSDDRFKAAVERNTTSVYNPLKRLVDRDEIRKEGTLYIPPDRNENSGSQGDAAA